MNRGKITTLLIVTVTIVLYFLSKPSSFDFSTNPWLYLSQLLALMGTALLSINYLLTTRVKIIETFFGGLDQVYHFHHFVGATSFVLMVNHPLFLVISRLPNVAVAKNYLLLGSDLSYNLGIFALYSFIIILFFTFLVKLPYHRWLLTHRVLGLPLILTLAHVFLIQSDVSRYLPLRLWVLMLLFVALWSYLYKLFIYSKIGPVYHYLVTDIKKMGDIVELYLSPQSKQLKFRPGQFVFVKFIKPGFSAESHPFSISSSPESPVIRLSVKKLGDYTAYIDQLTINSPVEITGPYGVFSRSFYQPKPVVILAGGIGVTPFLSMLATENTSPIDRPIDVYYCVKTMPEAVYDQELSSYLKTLPKYRYNSFCSQGRGYLTAAKLKEDLPNFNSSTFFLCGPKSFMDTLSQNLRLLGVKSKDIIFEDFSFYDSK